MRASSICATSLGKPPAFAIKKTSETPTLEGVAAGGNLFPAALVQSCGLPMSLAYRSLDAVLAQRVAAERVRRAADVPGTDTARRVMACRFGRAAAGAVGVLVGSAALITGLASFVLSGAHIEPTAATFLLLIAWPLAGLAWLLAWGGARLTNAHIVADLITDSSDPATALAWLEGEDPLQAARTRAMRWEFASVALPLAGLSLLCPLTIHWLLVTVVEATRGSGEQGATFKDFGGWIGLSAMLVGHAHLVLVACVVQWARSLRKRETHLLTTNVHTSWAVALLLTGLAACIPFAVPAAFVFLTGLVFIPVMYVVTARGVARERLSLEAG